MYGDSGGREVVNTEGKGSQRGLREAGRQYVTETSGGEAFKKQQVISGKATEMATVGSRWKMSTDFAPRRALVVRGDLGK